MASCLRLASLNAPRSSASIRASLQKANWLTRSVHRARGLPYDPKQGLGKFLSPPALETLVEYQEGLLERLNGELRTDPKAELHCSVAQVAINYADKRDRTLPFNFAVLALNNSFFLDQLAPTPEDKANHEDQISRTLLNQIELNYGDLARLKSSFSAAAMGMFSSGWVWLVSDSDGNLGILPTYGPSTLLVRSCRNVHYDPTLPTLGEDSARHAATNVPAPQLPSNNWGSPSSPASGVSSSQPFSHKPFEFQSRTMHTTSAVSVHNFQVSNGLFSKLGDTSSLQPKQKSSLMDVGKNMFPILCISVYEHAWMSAGYGVWGKEAWLREFWTVVDWSKVSNAYNMHIHAKHT